MGFGILRLREGLDYSELISEDSQETVDNLTLSRVDSQISKLSKLSWDYYTRILGLLNCRKTYMYCV